MGSAVISGNFFLLLLGLDDDIVTSMSISGSCELVKNNKVNLWIYALIGQCPKGKYESKIQLMNQITGSKKKTQYTQLRVIFF